MISELSAGYQGLKAAFDIVQGLNAAAKEAAINDIKIQLGRHINDAQSALNAAIMAETSNLKRIDALEAEIISMKDWETEKKRYELADTGQGSLAYRVKDGMERGEPPHWICPNCYQQGKKSILKHEIIPAGRSNTLVCHPCGFDIVTRGVRADAPRRAR